MTYITLHWFKCHSPKDFQKGGKKKGKQVIFLIKKKWHKT